LGWNKARTQSFADFDMPLDEAFVFGCEMNSRKRLLEGILYHGKVFGLHIWIVSERV